MGGILDMKHLLTNIGLGLRLSILYPQLHIANRMLVISLGVCAVLGMLAGWNLVLSCVVVVTLMSYIMAGSLSYETKGHF